MHFLHFVNTVHKESSFSPHANCKGQLHTALDPGSSRSCQTRVSSPLQGQANLAICQPALSSFHSTSVWFFSVLLICTHFFFSAGSASYLICKRGKHPAQQILCLCDITFYLLQTFLFTFTLHTKNGIDLGTSGNVWEILVDLNWRRISIMFQRNVQGQVVQTFL